MPRKVVILDTNVLISGLIFGKGLPHKITSEVKKNPNYKVIVDEEQWKEILRVLEYPKIKDKYKIREKEIDELTLFLEEGRMKAVKSASVEVKDIKDKMLLDA